MSFPPPSFGDLLRQYRVAAGLTQEMLAERARMSLAAIGKLERGSRQRPYRASVALLADALSLPLEDRLEFERAAHRGAAAGAETLDGAATTIRLPGYLSRFVGRERDVASVADALARFRLVSLIGAGGVGKTRLAIKAVEHVLDANALGEPLDGVWFCDLSSITDEVMIVIALAASVGVDGCTTLPALTAYLRAQTFLLIVDNCEHLLEPAARVTKTILSDCSGARVLTTSRQALSLDGERLYRVPPLSLPDAIQLFKDRAESIDNRFELTDAVAASVTDICRHIDGIALGIELAAARTNAFSPATIAQQLGEQFSLLTGGSREAQPRHHTMDSLFAWSYDLLDEREREVFRRASVFTGGFTLDLVCALYSERTDRRAIPLALASLVDKSLVQSDVLLDPTRYRLLEPARRYARDKLDERGESAEAARSHATAMLELAERYDARLDLIPDREWDESIERERDNFRAAFEWATGPRADNMLGLRLAASRTASWGGFKSGEIRTLGKVAFDAPHDRADPKLLAKLALGAARAAVYFERDPDARVLACRRALDAQAPGDLRALATAQYFLGVALGNMGRYEEAAQVLDRAREAARAAGADYEYTIATVALGTTRFGAGALEEARELTSEALQRTEAAGSDRDAADARVALAEIEFASGRPEQALALNRTAARFFRAHADIVGLPKTLSNSSAYLIGLERYDDARTVACEALRRSRMIGSVNAAYWAMQHLVAAVVLDRRRSCDESLRAAATILGFVDHAIRQKAKVRFFTEDYTYNKARSALRETFTGDRLAELHATGGAWTEETAVAHALALCD